MIQSELIPFIVLLIESVYCILYMKETDRLCFTKKQHKKVVCGHIKPLVFSYFNKMIA